MKHSSEGIDPKVFKKIAKFQESILDNEMAIYIGGKKFFKVELQPRGVPTFVSEKKNHVTSFEMPKKFGNLGFIAHNYLAGKYFKDIGEGDQIFVLDGKSQTRRYLVKDIQRERALDPKNPRDL